MIYQILHMQVSCSFFSLLLPQTIWSIQHTIAVHEEAKWAVFCLLSPALLPRTVHPVLTARYGIKLHSSNVHEQVLASTYIFSEHVQLGNVPTTETQYLIC